MVSFLVLYLPKVKSLEFLRVDNLSVVNKRAPSRTSWAMGHFDSVAVGIVDFVIPVIETFIEGHAYMRLSLAYRTHEIHIITDPWNDIIELNTKNQLLNLFPKLRSKDGSLI